MGRPREFDFDTALERAMQLFWAKGYESTSLEELCEATGLARSSLYGAFGDKHRLFVQALARYEDAGAARLDEVLARPLPIKAAIGALLAGVIDNIVAGPGRRGCLIGNSAAELARNDREVSARVRHSLERVEATFRAALARAQARGEIAADADVDALARFFTASMQGLRLVGKARPERAVLDDIARVMLRALDR